MISRYMEQNKLVMDTIERKATKGIPIACMNIMQHEYLDRIAGMPEGSYRNNPEEVYIQAQRNMNVCFLAQYIPTNPLEASLHGYMHAPMNNEKIVLDGITIDSPEAVIEHMEAFVFPYIHRRIASLDESEIMRSIVEGELAVQEKLGDSILKTGYGFVSFPSLQYFYYGYENYFMAYALYPEVIEKHFSLQADFAVLNNTAVSKLYEQKMLPPLYLLDHDMADSRGMLVDMQSLDKIWMPHFARSIEPVVKSGVKLLWHCDGNLMEMVPRLLSAGVSGLQGFQYEDGMDYQKICRLKTCNGESLLILAGVSVTRTLPFGTPQDVRDELKFLVDTAPETGLFLSASSSITPGVPWENIQTLIEGLAYYRANGRKGF